jgi:hypothetical protein
MRDFASTLFRVMCFPYNGNTVTINQLLFIYPHLMFNHPPSLNGMYMPAMSAPLQVNYVLTCPTRSTPHKREYLPSPDLDPVVNMVISSIGILEPDIPTLIKVVNMYSFQSDFLPSSEDLLEAMIDVYSFQSIVLLEVMIKKRIQAWFCFSMVSSFKNETNVLSIVFLSVASSLKNETKI